MINVFIIGARGYIRKYAGWTALIHGICNNQIDKNIQYYVYEVADNLNDETMLQVDNVIVIRRYVDMRKNKAMIIADAKNTFHAVKYLKNNKIENPVFLYLGLRVGPFVYLLRSYIKSFGVVIIENAAGVEWKRPKWGIVAQIYMRISAYFMARASDYLVCDAEGILDIYNRMIPFRRPEKLFIPYGSYPARPLDPILPDKVQTYFKKFGVLPKNYYLIINRFMPENSYELILNEYVKSDTRKELILVTNNDKESEYYERLSRIIPFKDDPRIKFVGTQYDTEILDYLRQNAFAYINGHTLGGTNPGLLEAMASTGIVLANNNIFSKEVCGESAIYYDNKFTLREAMMKCEAMSSEDRNHLITSSRARMKQKYDWNDIVKQYESLFEKAHNKERQR